MGRRIGLIAGSGLFPLMIIEEAHRQGFSCVVAGIRGEADEGLIGKAQIFEWIDLLAVEKFLSFFKQHGVDRVLMAGKVEHRRVFQETNLDSHSPGLLKKIREKSPTHLIGAFIDFMDSGGVRVVEPTAFLTPYFCREGVLTETPLSPEVEEDIQYGLNIARRVADLDVGQTVIIKDKAVVGVEGMEGTDEAIRRNGELIGEGFVVVKVGRSSQDLRIDVPAVGLSTVKTLAEARGKALCIEAERVLFFQREQAISLANSESILILARKIDKM